MSQTKTKPVKAKGGFTKMGPQDLAARATSAHDGFTADPVDFPSPPVDMPTFKTNIDLLTAKNVAALDGGKKAIADRNHQAVVVRKMLEELAHYAQVACKDDLTIFLKSGLEAKSTSPTASQPLSEAIRKVIPGPNSGQFLVTPVSLPGASAYEIRCGGLGPGGAPPTTWTTQIVGRTRPPALITGLTPGTTYLVQVRAALKVGYTDWSESVTRIAV
jgi:hypothetical protein